MRDPDYKGSGADHTVAFLAALGIKRTEITPSMLQAVHWFASDIAEQQTNHKMMMDMMRRQRDSFRAPRERGGVGAAHSDEARHCCAELLDWFLVSFPNGGSETAHEKEKVAG